jgi:ATP-dependent DNA helicase RecQ
MANCANCSNCNDDSEAADITLEAQKIFSTVKRMRESYGINLVADVLKGAKNKKVLQFGFDKLTTYGLMSEYKVKDIVSLINILVSEGYLSITEGGYPVLKLEAKSNLVLKNEEKVLQKVKKRKQKAAEDTTLYDVLRKLRKHIAEEEKVPPYVIFHDSTIHELSKVSPTTEIELLSISGIGERKMKKYGVRFLQEIRKYNDENGIISNISYSKDPEGLEADDDKPKKKTKEVPSHVLSFEMYKGGKNIDEISKERNLKPMTIQDHILKCASEGYKMNWDSFIPKEYEDLIAGIIKKLGSEKLRPIKDALPDDIDYMAIKAVICKLKM